MSKSYFSSFKKMKLNSFDRANQLLLKKKKKCFIIYLKFKGI